MNADALASLVVAMVAAGQVAFGISYVGVCEVRAGAPGQCDKQWLTGFAMLFGGSATGMGLATKNPLLRDERHDRMPAPPQQLMDFPEPPEPIPPAVNWLP